MMKTLHQLGIYTESWNQSLFFILISFLLSGIIANYLDGIFDQDGVYLVLIGSSTLILISGILNFINGYRSIFNEFGIEKSNFNNIKLKLDEKE